MLYSLKESLPYVFMKIRDDNTLYKRHFMKKNIILSFFYFTTLFFVGIFPLFLKSAHRPMTRKRKEVCLDDPIDARVLAREDFLTDIVSHGIDTQGEKGSKNRNISARIKFYEYAASNYADQETQETVALLSRQAGLSHKKFYTCEGNETEIRSFKPVSDTHFILQLESKETKSEQRFSILHEMGHVKLMSSKDSFYPKKEKAANHQEELFADLFATNILLENKDFQPVASGILSFLTINHKECFTHPASERRARLMLTVLEKKLEEQGESLNSLCEKSDSRLDRGTKLALKRAINKFKKIG